MYSKATVWLLDCANIKPVSLCGVLSSSHYHPSMQTLGRLQLGFSLHSKSNGGKQNQAIFPWFLIGKLKLWAIWCNKSCPFFSWKLQRTLGLIKYFKHDAQLMQDNYMKIITYATLWEFFHTVINVFRNWVIIYGWNSQKTVVNIPGECNQVVKLLQYKKNACVPQWHGIKSLW